MCVANGETVEACKTTMPRYLCFSPPPTPPLYGLLLSIGEVAEVSSMLSDVLIITSLGEAPQREKPVPDKSSIYEISNAPHQLLSQFESLNPKTLLYIFRNN